MRSQRPASAALPLAVSAIALALAPLQLLAQEIAISGNCPLAERTFAVGDAITFSYQPPLADSESDRCRRQGRGR
jgi:hypothetical protein